jgi:hypothetical protein
MDSVGELQQALSAYRSAKEQSERPEAAARAELLREHVRLIARSRFRQDLQQVDPIRKSRARRTPR